MRDKELINTHTQNHFTERNQSPVMLVSSSLTDNPLLKQLSEAMALTVCSFFYLFKSISRHDLVLCCDL